MAARLAKGWTRPAVFSQPPLSIPVEQLSIFPRQAILEFPKPPGADIFQTVQADNGKFYHLKLDRSSSYTRASEMICHKLADLVGIRTPNFEFIKTFSGDVAFGSEIISTVYSDLETIAFLQTPSLNEIGQSINELSSPLSAIHAFDLFVGNTDRHYGNFLVSGRDIRKSLYAIDFARALFWQWPLSGFASSNDATTETWIELRQRHGFDLNAALLVVDRLSIITVAQVESPVSQLPTHWLTDTLRQEVLSYCADGRWAARVRELRQGLESGSVV